MRRGLVWKHKILYEEDLGIVTVGDDDGNPYEAFRSQLLVKRFKGKPPLWETVDIDRREIVHESYNLGISMAQYRHSKVREIVDRWRK